MKLSRQSILMRRSPAQPYNTGVLRSLACGTWPDDRWLPARLYWQRTSPSRQGTPRLESHAKQGDAPVLFVAPQPVYEDRGTPIAIRHVLRALSQKGRRVDLLTYPIGEDLDLPGLRIFRVGSWLGWKGVSIGFSGRKLVLDLLIAAAIGRRLRAEPYAFIHAVEEAAFPAVLAGARRGLPVLYDMHSSLPEQLAQRHPFRSTPVQRGLRTCERWLIRTSDAVVCSAGLSNHVRRANPLIPVWEWRFPGQALEFSPSGVESLRARMNLARDASVVLYTGSFEPYQDLPLLVAAMAETRRKVPGAILVLVGAPDEARARPLADGMVHIVGRRRRAEIQNFLALADVVVSPRSRGDNLPLKVFDYMAAGRPIVAVDGSAHRAVLDDATALLVPAEPHALGTALARLLCDRTLAQRLGEAARRKATAEFGWSEFVKQVTEVYDHLQQHLPREADGAATTAATREDQAHVIR